MRVTASFTGSGAQTFTVATQGSGKTNDLTGSGSVDVATGGLAGTTLVLAVGGESQAVSFSGRLHGADGVSLTGVFANSAAINSKYYAGAIVASGTVDLAIIAGGPHGTATTSAPAVARGTYDVNGHGAAQSALFLVPQGSGALFAANHASANIRNNALVTKIGTIGGTASDFDVPTRSAGDLDLSIRSRAATVSHGGATPGVTVYEDRGGDASLLAVGGTNQLLAAGGAALTNVPATGAYTWQGVQLLGAAGDLANLTPGRFTLTATFSGAATAAFIYTGGTATASDGTLTASGNVTSASGVFESSASGFSIAGVAASAITEGRLFGRLSGDGASAVSGLFATTNTGGTIYAGGFAGGAPQILFPTHEFTGTGEEGGFGEAFVTLDTDTANSRVVFVANDLDALETEANVASDSARAASLLDAIVTTGSFPITTTTLRIAVGEGGDYAYGSGTAGLDRYVAGANDATLLVVDGSGQSGESVIAHVVKPRTGGFVSGAHTWQGVHLTARRDDLDDTSRGAFQITASFSAAATASFTYSTIGVSQPFTLSGSGTITKSTGRIASTALTFDADGAGTVSSTQTARLQGEFGGAGGESLVGLFATTSGASGHAGGFVGTGKQDVHTILDETSDHVGLGYVADRNLGTGTANGLVLVGDDYDALLATTRGALDATRDASIVAGIAPTGLSAADQVAIGAGHPQAFANEKTGGSIAFGSGGASYTVTAWEDGSGAADLLFLNGTGVSNSGSFFIAGGNVRPVSSVLTGSYSWEGVLVYAGKSIHTGQQKSGFRLTADFSNAGAGTFTATSASGDISGGVTIDADTGRISRRGNLQVAGSARGGEISGFVSGSAAEAVSGVFTTGSGTTIAGGFVGGAPRVGRDIALPSGAGTGGLAIGQAARDVFGTAHDTGGIIFLGDGYAARRDAINVASDATRAAQLLSNLGVTFTAPVFENNIKQYTLAASPSSNRIQYGSSSFEQGVVFEDASGSARLFALRSGNDGFFVSGGRSLSGPISGAFAYEGAFFSANQGALGTLREGTFELTATFVAGGNGSFTFAGSTVAAGAQTSRLEVKSGGTLTPATGRLTAAAATYIQGDGSAKTHDARIEGSIHGVGGVAVAGLFTTTASSGTNHAGGFAGSVLEFATQILTGFDGRPVPASEGFAQSGMIVIPVIGGGLTRLFTPDLDNSLGDANNSVAVTRQGAYLRQFAKSIAAGDITAGTASGNIVKNRQVTGYSYPDSGTAIPAKLTQDWLGLAGILAANATNVSGADANRAGSLLITGGTAFTGTLSGQYTWTGVQLVGESNTLETLTEESVRVTASFTSSGAQTFTIATQGSSKTNELTGSGSVDVATGELGGTGISLSVGGVSQTVSFVGSLHGGDGASLSGVFANSVAIGGKYYAGAIIASGALDLAIIAGGPHGTSTTSTSAIARGLYNVNAHGAAQSALFLVPQGSSALFEANHASANIRNNALATNLGAIGGTGANFDVSNRAQGDLDLAIRSRSATVSHGAVASSVTVYEDRGGNASLLAAGGSSQLLASGGAAVTGVPTTGAYTWEGVQLLGDADDLAGLTRGRFTLTTTFSGAATAVFSYTGGTTTAADGTLTASGNITTASGALESSAAGFSLAGLQASAITEGKLFGRLSGAGASAVSGLFVTTNASGDRYAGGFVGGAPQIVFSTHAFTGTGEEGGFGEAFVTLDADTTNSRLVFVSNDLDALKAEANVASDTARAASLLDAIVTTTGSPTTTTTLGITGSPGGSYAYKSGTAGLDRYVAGASDARLFVINGSEQSGESVIAHLAKPHTGTFSNGAYTWQGVQLSAERAELHDTTAGAFQITATFGNAATTSFTYATIGASQPFTLSGTGTITKSTGKLASTALSFDADGAGSTSSAQTTRFQGTFGGADAESFVGLFATTSGTTGYAGGFVGTGKQDVHTLLDETTDHVGLGFVADRNIGAGTANGLALVGDDYDALLATTRGAVDATRDASIVANIAPTGLAAASPVAIGADHPQAFANEKTGGSIAFGSGGASYTVTAWEDGSGTADLLFLNGTGVSNSGSFFIAGGDARPASSTLTGGYGWEGVLVYAGKSLHTNQRKSGFRLTANFANGGNGTFTGTSDSGTISGGVTVDADTGRITGSGAIQVAGTASGGEISGFVSGSAGEAVSGVFTTSSGTILAGGFVGGAPRVGRDIARPSGSGAGGVAIGQAARDVFGTAHDTGSIIFLGDDYAAHRDAVNVASDTTRATRLLSNLGATLTAPVFENNVNRYTLAASPSSNRIQYGSSSFEQGVVFEDGSRSARLFALRSGTDGFFVSGGRNLSGSISGTFEYEGVFVSATQGALGTLREGTFELTATFVSGGTGSFTFAGSTGSAGARTSRLEVTSGGTLASATGRLTAAAATYIQGGGSTKTHDARIEGSIHGIGGVAVAGLFTTTESSGTNHAGGFAGSALEFATQILTGFDGRPSPASEGFARSNRIVIPVIGGGLTRLFTPDLDNILDDANSSDEATRQGAYLRQFANVIAAGDITAGTASGNLVKNRAVTGYTYPDSGTAIPANLTQDWLGLAGILAADATNVSGASANRAGSLLITGGAAFTGTLLGRYTWSGVQLVGESNALETRTEESVQVTANFTGSGAQTFTVATQGSSKTNDLTGSGSVDVATGELGGTGISLSVGGVSQTVSFTGALHGGDGAALSGVFANSVAIGGKYYAGAILASGAIELPIIAGGPHGTRTISAPAIARGLYNVNGHGAAQSALFLVPQGSGALFEANHASANVRNNALAANLGTIGGTASDFDVPDRVANDLDLAIRTRSTTVSHGGETSSVTVYEDRGGSASLLTVGGLGPLLASGGVAATDVPTTGAYTWEGVQLLGDADDLAGLTRGRFTLTTTFSGAATAVFSYTGGTTTAADGTLTASGNITTASGALESSAAGFSLAGVEASAITEGKLFGRLSGAGASAVSGLFVTTNTSDDRYAGGFVGGAPQIVFSTHAFTGAGEEGGFGEAFVTLDAQATTSRVAFVSNDLGALETEANVASDTARAASLLDAIVTTGGSTTTTTTLRVTGNTGGSYSYKSGTAGLDRYAAGANDARLFVIDGSGQSGESVIAHVVKPQTGSIATGAHTWQGVHLFARRDDLDNTTDGTFQITASFSAAATAGFAYTTIGAEQSFTLSGSGTITKSTGGFASTTLSFDADGTGTASSAQTARLQGAFGGADAQSLVGLFATTSGASGHAGGFIGTGKQDVHTILNETSDHVGLGYVADRNLGTGAANGLVLVGDDYDALLATTRGAVDATRDASILANIAPTGLSAASPVAIGVGYPQAFANERTGGSIAFGSGGASYAVTAWEDEDGAASLLFLNGTGVANSGSLIVAGGDSRPAAGVLTGGYSWEGVLVYSGKSLHTGQSKSGFRLTADFTSAGTGTFTGTSTGGDITAGVTIDAGTGRISRRGDLRVAGGAAGGEISGFVSGASAQAVSGVFTTGSGTTIAGGFVGGAPRVARDIARPAGAGTGGLTIGEAARDVFATAHDTGNIIFLGDAYATRRDAVNVTSDTTRAAQLLSSLGATLSDGTLENSVNKYTLAASPSTNRIQYGASSFEQGAVFEDGGGTARLFALGAGSDGFFVAGGRNLSGPISGAFEYEGVFVSATQGALGTLREGAFELTATFVAGGNGSFTFDGTTTASGTPGTAGARTSRLEVKTGGTLTPATGRLTAAAATYIQGDGSAKTHDARIEGSIFGVGGVGVAGVFTTTATAGTNHAGGFAGSVLEFASQILTGFDGRPTPASEGFARSDRIVLPVIGGGLTNLFTPDLDNILSDANSSVETTRQGAFLRQFAKSIAAGDITAGTASGNIVKNREVTGYSYPDSGTTISAKLTQDWLGLAGVLASDATSVPGANANRAASLLITGGAAFTGGLSGQYTWTGVQLVGESNTLETITEEAVRVTASFTGSGAQTFTVATQGSSKTNELTGSGSVDVATGELGGTGISLSVGGVSQTVSFTGSLHGGDGAALSGVFANSVAIGGKYYAGAIIASGALDLAIIAGGPHGTRATSAPAIARGLYNVNGHGAAQSALFLVPQGSSALFQANHASANIRNNALATNLGTIGGSGADFDVPNRTVGDLDLAIRTRSATVSHGGATPSVTVYEDRGGNASLLAAGGSGPLLAAGGVAATGVPTTGAYTWEGVQLLGAAGDLASLTPGRFTLTTTFSGAATAVFSYTGGTTTAADGTLTASGDITRASGALESSASGFSLAGLQASAITEGKLFGRLSGAGASAVSGLFVTTNSSGNRYAGGFVGGAPQIVFSTHAFTGTGEEGGFGEAFVTLNADATNSRLVFVSNDLDALRTEANVASDSARAASLLDAIVTTGGSPTTTTTLRVTGSAGGSYTYKSGTAGLDRYVAGTNDVTLLVVDGSAQSGESVIAHLAKPHTGAFSNGAYTWQGVQLSAARSELHDTTSGAFQITATFSNAATANFAYTTIGASRPFTLSGNGTITKSTGGLAATALSFDADGAGATSSTQTARLQGTFGGADGESLVGLFATTSGTTGYAGGFVGTGKQDVHTILDETTDHVGLGYVADRNIGAGTANGLVLVGDDYDALLATTRGAVDATRDASIVAKIAPTGLSATGPAAIGVDHPQAFANERTGGSISFGAGGTSYTVTAWEDGSGAADLLFLNGTGVSSSGSFFIAGGDDRPASSVLTGSYSWEGVLVYAGKSLHTGQSKSGFRLTADFANAGAGTFTGTSIGGDITAGVTVDSGTGRISRRGNLQVAGSVAGGEISGFVSGDAAEAVSGVFTTGLGTTIAGGFVGGAPRVGRDIARPAGAGTGGFEFGEAARDVFGTVHGTGDIIFLGNDYETRRDAINVTSDTTRAAQLLSNLGAALTGGTFKDNINRYTLSSSNNLQYGSSSFEQGAVFEDGSRSAKLFALRSGNDGFFVSGGRNLSGSISGTFEYEGTFVSATQGAFGALREGTFALTATFVSGGTGSFTFAGSTSAAGAQTSRLEVASGGTLVSATGRLTAAAATYILGDGSTKTHDARIEGSIHGVGGVAVAGLFTTTETSGTNHAGGFAGSVLEFATQILTGFDGRPAPASEGFARSGMIVLPVIGGGLTRLFTPDLDNSLGDANNSVAATRQGAYLRQFAKSIAGSDIAAGTVSGNLVKNREVTGYTYPDSSTAIPAKLTQDWLGLAGILAADATNVSGASANRAGSLLITGGAALTGSLSGQYTWTGVQLVGESNTLKTLTEEAVQVTASFTSSGAQTFTVATQGSSKTNDLTGSGSVDVATGALGGTGLSLAVGGVSQTVSFAGSLHGAFGASLSGVFANSEAIGGKYYAGAILASGALDLPIIAGGPHGTRTTSAPAIARGLYNVNGHGAAQSALFLAPQGSSALFDANHASATIRNNALATNLGTVGGTAADFDVPNRAADDLDLAIRTRSAPVSHGGATPNVTVYEDRGGDASLLVAGGSGPLLASGGVAATNVPATGAYTWEGVQLLGDAGDLAGLTPGRFTLTTTFSGAATAAFIYTGGTTTAANGTLTASGNITRATGALKSSAAGFSLAGVEALAITEGKLFGRLSGTGASAVSGLFVTTNTGDDRYAGGFVGGAPQIVFSTHAFTGAGEEGGFGEAFVTLDAEATTSRVVFVSNDLDALKTEANVASDSARAGSLLDAIVTTGSFGATTTPHGIVTRTGGGYVYKSGTASLNLYAAGKNDVRLFVINGSSQAGASAIAHVAKPHTGSPVNGAHTWQGTHLFSQRNELDHSVIYSGRFQVTATFSAAATASFFYSTKGASQSFTLSGSGTITKSTGRLASTALTFDADGTGTASSTQTARLQGEFGGADGAALVGLFATTNGTTHHAGGFVGAGPEMARAIHTASDDTVLGAGDFKLPSSAGAATPLLFVAEDGGELIDEANSPVDATRATALFANLNPTLSGTPAAIGRITKTTGTGTVTGRAGGYNVSARTSPNNDALLYVIDTAPSGGALGNAAPLIVAGGKSGPTDITTLNGGYTWDGTHVWAGRSDLENTTEGTFRITATFNGTLNGSFAYVTTGSSPAGALTVTSSHGTVNTATGDFSSDNAIFTKQGGSGQDAALRGLFNGGAADALSGVFMTTGNTAGTTYHAGGFVGAGPEMARAIHTASDDTVLGAGDFKLPSSAGAATPLLFVAEDGDELIDEANSQVDATRATALFANLNPTLSGTPAAIGRITKTTGTGTVTGRAGGYNVSARTSPNNDALLYVIDTAPSGGALGNAAPLIVAGGKSGPTDITALTGGYTWDGTYRCGPQGPILKTPQRARSG